MIHIQTELNGEIIPSVTREVGDGVYHTVFDKEVTVTDTDTMSVSVVSAVPDVSV